MATKTVSIILSQCHVNEGFNDQRLTEVIVEASFTNKQSRTVTFFG